jgi:hypothetical protein
LSAARTCSPAISGPEAAKLKLTRAAEHIKEIESHVERYASRVTHEVTPPQAQGNEAVLVSEVPPPEISVIAGEAIHQIRSALDYLAFDLVKLNPTSVTLPPEWETHCCFPLWLQAPKNPPVYNCFGRALPGISVPAFTFIESAQPYNRGSIGNVLRHLAVLSNVDKHRHLNLTSPRIGHLKSATLKSGFSIQTYHTMRSGEELRPEWSGEGLADIEDVTINFSTFVTFDESTLGYGPATLGVEDILKACLKTVQDAVVPEFDKLIGKQ